MTPESSSPSVRYESLGDYLRVLRRYWIMVAALALLGGGAGYAYQKGQAPSYKATAEVSFQDPLQQVGIVGLPANTPQTPGQLAAVAADLVTAPSVIDQVQRELHMSDSANALTDAIAAAVAPSGLLAVTVTTSRPNFATELANKTAQVLVAQDNAQVRAQLARLAADVQKRLAVLQRHPTPATNSQLAFYEGELGPLETLSSYAKTAQFAKPATTAVSSSPGAARSTALGVLLGLLLGVIVAFVRDGTDGRLRGGKDVETSFGLPVLGHVRNRAMGRIVQLSEGRGTGQMDVEAFRIVRRNLELLDPWHPLKVILTTSAVADEGKTTVAGSLAASIAATGKRTLLIEADLRRPTLAPRLQVEPVPGLSDYLTGHATPQEVLRTISFAEPPDQNGSGPSANGDGVSGVHKLVYIPAGSRTTHAAELIGSQRFNELIEQASDTYDAIVLDSAPLLPVSDTLEILPHVQAVAFCVRESQTTRDQALAAKTALSRWPGLRVGVVLTGIKPRGTADEAVYTHEYA